MVMDFLLGTLAIYATKDVYIVQGEMNKNLTFLALVSKTYLVKVSLSNFLLQN